VAYLVDTSGVREPYKNLQLKMSEVRQGRVIVLLDPASSDGRIAVGRILKAIADSFGWSAAEPPSEPERFRGTWRSASGPGRLAGLGERRTCRLPCGGR